MPRRLAINFLFLSCGEITAKLLTFLCFSYLAHTLGPARYGSVEFTLAVMVFFTLPVDLGLSWYGTRETASNPSCAARLLHEITGLRLLLGLCSVAALGIFILFLNKGADQRMILVLYGVSLLGAPFLLQWFLQGHDRMGWVALVSLVRQAAFVIPVFLICRRQSQLWYIGAIECFSVAVVVAFSIYVTHYKLNAPWPWPDLRFSRMMPHLREASPIGFTELAWAFMWYFCTVLLGFLSTDRTLGWFGASHRILMALHAFVMLYFLNLLPSISRCAGRPHEELLRLMDGSIRFVSWTGLLVAGVCTAAAPEALRLVYGT
ncbi:MAG: oligosaccharide flippase family protein, partial [Bryobacteraceae bacterium]